jgi:dihydroflavonol-4-reductase
LDDGRAVRVLIHEDRRAIEGLDVEVVRGDVRDPGSLRGAFEGADVVYHAAGLISLMPDAWPILEAVNVAGVRNVVEACQRESVRRLVHVSSIHAMVQEPLDVPIDESRPLVKSRRCPPYDRSKAAGELEVREGIAQGLDAVIISPTGIIGPNDFRPSHFGEALLAMREGRLPALPAGGFDWVDVRDVVEGAMRAEERAPAGAKYLVSGNWVSVRGLAEAVADVTGARVPRLTCPLWLGMLGAPFATAWARWRGERPLFTGVSFKALRSNPRVSHERASSELDYAPRPFRQTLVDTFRWFDQAKGSAGAAANSLEVP